MKRDDKTFASTLYLEIKYVEWRDLRVNSLKNISISLNRRGVIYRWNVPPPIPISISVELHLMI